MKIHGFRLRTLHCFVVSVTTNLMIYNDLLQTMILFFFFFFFFFFLTFLVNIHITKLTSLQKDTGKIEIFEMVTDTTGLFFISIFLFIK